MFEFWHVPKGSGEVKDLHENPIASHFG